MDKSKKHLRLTAQFAGSGSPIETKNVRVGKDGEILVETGGKWEPNALLRTEDCDYVRHTAGYPVAVPLTHR